MKIILIKIAILLSLLSLFSCVTNNGIRGSYPAPTFSEADKTLEEATNAKYPTDEELKKIKYGKQPKNYETVFKKILKENLKDPDSAKFRNIQKPKKFWGKSLTIRNSWLVCGEVNSKNSYGGYSGFERYAMQFFEGGEVSILPLEEGKTMFTFSSEPYPCSN